MKTTKILFKLFIAIMLIVQYGCKKENDFLQTVPNEALTIPKNLNDLKQLMDDDYIFNSAVDPGIGQASCDDYYVGNALFIHDNSLEQNIYVWAKDIYPNINLPDWSNSYGEIYNANVVLDALSSGQIKNTDQTLFNTIKGRALFFRAVSFYNLLQLFAKPYNSTTAATDLGIPIRLSSDFNVKSVRSSVQQGYTQIINDLQVAAKLLPATDNLITHPVSMSAEGFLSRVYLTMSDFTNGLKAANLALSSNANLTDFNSLIPTQYFITDISQFPLTEMSYYTSASDYYIAATPFKAIPDTLLYASYDNNDLRKSFFFQTNNGQLIFTGNYNFKDSFYRFDGVANDEVYLNRAECNARIGNTQAAMNDLNTLLIKRYITGTYVQRTAATPDDALVQILTERRKELIFRGTRWTDLRRLNQDTRFAITLQRKINGAVYTLPPNDLRYTFAIPDPEIQLDGLQQNPR